ncbi:MAG: hypothetical protein UR51_C0005G0074 [Candidatus Moranbacteria bacterium GW2011_GWF1_34_10]|nr:MAG: hypothetical protein UR51_C0005G0074 [Candidatus Moranbacteria bacterium GW2011_GWF1_34_10]
MMSERKDGSMKLLEDDLNVENRSNFFVKNGIDKENVFMAGMIHDSKVAIVDKNSPNLIEGVDALVSKEKIFLAVTVADCVPVYFYDEKNKIIGVAHAGWKGITKGIIKNTLDKIIQLGGDFGNIEVVLGPGIQKCHFEIKEDIVDKFKKYPQFVIFKKDKIFVDLFGIIKRQLLDYKIKNRNISVSKECTFEDAKRYFSYRRDKPERVEVMMAMIGLK